MTEKKKGFGKIEIFQSLLDCTLSYEHNTRSTERGDPRRASVAALRMK
jgi:hypothetical protein